MRKIAITLAILCQISSAEAKNMTGVIDLTGKVIIPLQYKSIRPIGEDFYLCEGFNAAPGAVLPKPSVDIFSAVRQNQDALVAKHFSGSQTRGSTIVLDRNGKPFPVRDQIVIEKTLSNCLCKT